MHETETILAEQFDDFGQQTEAATVGMWTFLATEVLFFGGLFLAYTVYRTIYPGEFAVGSHYGNVMLGTINTFILLTSSLTVALAVRAAQLNENKSLVRLLGCTIFFGVVFLVLKGMEYDEHIRDHLFPGSGFRKDLSPKVELYFWLYFVMTGLHAIHVLVGIGVLSVMMLMAWKKRFSSHYHNPIEISGLYWHFVDIVWVFLYPLLYLIHP